MKKIFFAALLLVSTPSYSRPLVLANSLWGHAASYAGVNVATLYGIAVQESSMRWQDGSFRPWPWTLNVNTGKKGIKAGVRRYRDQRSALAALTRFIAAGIRNVDIGLMQINLRWHGERVANELSLLEPRTNISVAAQILKEVNNNDIPLAVANYHSFNPARGQTYASHVKRYERIIYQQIQ
ncbi:MAG: hypothetical protein EPN89_03950 [Methylovulum sp.]|nr:MAG: hypothetical protein EPN89_03950 [Methylovulum sp.]